MKLPAPFIEQMKNLLGPEYSDFESALYKSPPVSIRLNPNKKEHALQLGEAIPWCDGGYYLEQRPVFTIDPYFHAGHYYVQEASSMFLDFILKNLKIKSNARILDLCSAPGGKSTLLLSYLANKGFLHCHEFDSHRVGKLRQNIERWGYPNTIITYGSLSPLQNSKLLYDVILIDAPCSGEGMFRKEEEAWKQWNQKKIHHCSTLQRNILNIADSLCANDGHIIYSTCTWNSYENEEILHPHVANGKYKSIRIKNNFNINEYHNLTYTYRLFPHKVKGEGYTVSVLKKEDTSEHSEEDTGISHFLKKQTQIELKYWLDNHESYVCIPLKETYYSVSRECSSDFNKIYQSISTTSMGIPTGKLKGTDFYPAHGLSQSINLNKNIPHFNMDAKQTLEYLKASTLSTQFTTDAQWLVASYQSANLGWLKSGGSGIKNYFPKNQRIVSF